MSSLEAPPNADRGMASSVHEPGPSYQNESADYISANKKEPFSLTMPSSTALVLRCVCRQMRDILRDDAMLEVARRLRTSRSVVRRVGKDRQELLSRLRRCSVSDGGTRGLYAEHLETLLRQRTNALVALENSGDARISGATRQVMADFAADALPPSPAPPSCPAPHLPPSRSGAVSISAWSAASLLFGAFAAGVVSCYVLL